MAQRWYEFRSEKHGSITCKGRSEEEAREEAAERKCCGVEELICVDHEPYYKPHIPPPPRIGGFQRRVAENQ